MALSLIDAEKAAKINKDAIVLDHKGGKRLGISML